MEKFPDVQVNRDTTKCVICKKPFELGHKLLELHVIAGIDSYKRVHVSEFVEYGHFNCFNEEQERESPLLKPPTNETIEKLRPTIPAHLCKICKNPLKRGERIVLLYVVLGGGIDPETNAPGIMCSNEFESAHAKCNDPKLDIGEVLIVGG